MIGNKKLKQEIQYKQYENIDLSGHEMTSASTKETMFFYSFALMACN